MQIRIIHDISQRLFEILSKPFTVVLDASPRLLEILDRLAGPKRRSAITRVTFRGTGVTIEGESITMATGLVNQVGEFTATFIGERGTEILVPNCVWSSSDDTAASVVADATNPQVGIVTLLTEGGNAIILCTDNDPDHDPATSGNVECSATVFCRAENVTVASMAEGTFHDPAAPPVP